MTKLLTSQAGHFVEVDVPTPTRGYVVVDFGAGKTVTSAVVWTPITALSVPIVQVAAIASADHTADEHLVEEMDVMAGPPYAGVGFLVYAKTRNVRLFGKYIVAWMWS